MHSAVYRLVKYFPVYQTHPITGNNFAAPTIVKVNQSHHVLKQSLGDVCKNENAVNSCVISKL